MFILQLEKKQKDNRIKKPIIRMDAWKKLLKNGNWARVLLESEYCIENSISTSRAKQFHEKAVKMKQNTIAEGLNRKDLTKQIQYSYYINISQDLGRKQKFKESLNYIKKALKVFKNDEKALWGLASAYYHRRKFRKSIKIYNKLIKLNSDNLRYKFELGTVWLHLDVDYGLGIIDKVMLETNIFDYFRLRVAELKISRKQYKEAKINLEKYLNIFSNSRTARTLLKIVNDKLIGE